MSRHRLSGRSTTVSRTAKLLETVQWRTPYAGRDGLLDLWCHLKAEAENGYDTRPPGQKHRTAGSQRSYLLQGKELAQLGRKKWYYTLADLIVRLRNNI